MATSIKAGDKVMYTLENGGARVAEVTFIAVAPGGTLLNLVVTLDPLESPQYGGKLHLGVIEAKQGEPGEAKKWYPMS